MPAHTHTYTFRNTHTRTRSGTLTHTYTFRHTHTHVHVQAHSHTRTLSPGEKASSFCVTPRPASLKTSSDAVAKSVSVCETYNTM